LPEKLQAELPGILAWAVQGCLAWQKDGLGEPAEVQQATKSYRTDMDVLGQFITECCLVDSNTRTKASDLYDAYKFWCSQNGERGDIQRTWGMALTERGFERRRGTGGAYWWIGLGLLSKTPSGEGGVPDDHAHIVNQVNHSEPRNGIHSSEILRAHVLPFSGSLGSLGSLPVQDAHRGSILVSSVELTPQTPLDSLDSLDAVQQNRPRCGEVTGHVKSAEGGLVCTWCSILSDAQVFRTEDGEERAEWTL
jgi:hypothetical protein